MTPTQRLNVYRLKNGSFKTMGKIHGLHWAVYSSDHNGVRLKPEHADKVFDTRKEAFDYLKSQNSKKGFAYEATR